MATSTRVIDTNWSHFMTWAATFDIFALIRYFDLWPIDPIDIKIQNVSYFIDKFYEYILCFYFFTNELGWFEWFLLAITQSPVSHSLRVVVYEWNIDTILTWVWCKATMRLIEVNIDRSWLLVFIIDNTYRRRRRDEWVLFYIHTIYTAYTVWVKKYPPEIFWHIFPNSWEFLVQILRAY